MREKMKTDHEALPPLIEHLIKETTDKKVHVFKRQNQRDRLVRFRDIIDEALKQWDREVMELTEKKKTKEKI